MERSELALWSPCSPQQSSAGLLQRVLLGREGLEFSRVWCKYVAHGSRLYSAGCSLSAHGLLPPSWTEVSCTALLRTGCRPEMLGMVGLLWELIHLVRCKDSAHGPLWASETRLSTKEEVRTYHLDSTLFFPVPQWALPVTYPSRTMKSPINSLPLPTVSKL